MDFDLRRLQLTELEMLKDVADFCDRNDISYFLSSGTMLGAARHSGFIPWDDDIDICMDVNNYKKFVKLAPEGLPKQYFVQNYRTDPKSCIRWTKVRINGTTSMEKNLTNYDIHYGICMDVFVMTGIPEGRVKAIRQKKASVFMSILLEKYLAEAQARSLSKLEVLLYTMIPEAIRRKIIMVLEKMVLLETNKYPKCYNTFYVLSDTAKTYSSSIFDKNERIKMRFEDMEFWAFGEWEEYLKDDYGDWRTLPPEDEREAHGDIIVDFDHDYKDYYTGK